MVIKTKVAQQHAATKNHGGGVGLVLALDVETDVSATGLEDGDLTAHVAARDNTGAADQGGTNVGQDATVQVGHDHDVELLGAGDGLHGGVVDNHVVDLEGRVLLCGVVEGAAEEAVGELHDVGLVDAGDLGAAVGEGEGKGELCDTLRLGAGDDLEGLDDAVDALVLEARVLALGVLADDAHVYVLVARLVAGDVLDQTDGGVDVELLAHGHVEALVAGAADGRVQDTLEAKLVAAQRSDALAEGVLSAPALDARHGDLLPLDGHVVRLEDGLNRLGHLGTDAVAGNQRHRVLAAELGRLEDVGLDRREGSGCDLGGSNAAQDLHGHAHVSRELCQFIGGDEDKVMRHVSAVSDASGSLSGCRSRRRRRRRRSLQSCFPLLLPRLSMAAIAMPKKLQPRTSEQHHRDSARLFPGEAFRTMVPSRHALATPPQPPCIIDPATKHNKMRREANHIPAPTEQSLATASCQASD